MQTQSLQRAARNALSLVGKGGPLKSVQEFGHPADVVNLVTVGVEPWPHHDREGVTHNLPFGSGFAFSWEEALVAAAGEAIERMSLCEFLHDKQARITAPYDALRGRAVDPTRFDAFSPEQYARPDFPYRHFRRDEPIEWIPGVSLTEGGPVLIPADVSYLGYSARTYTTSSGSASHSSVQLAMRAALYELVERDALTLTWLGRLSRPHVDVRAFGSEPLVAECVRRIENAGLRLHVLDLTNDLGVPVFGCVVEGDGRPALGFGAGCNLNPALAARTAVKEAAAAWNWAGQQIDQGPPPPLPAPGEAVSMEFAQHVRLYAEPSMKPRAAFLWADPTVVQPPAAPSLTPSEEIREVVARLARRGQEVYAVDLTLPQLVPHGYRVVRVLSPGLALLHAGVGYEFLGCKRIGGRPANPDPHPFP
jgi:ribosomal protein S12 methylthiotransferase accessory factor